jgi:hypothetical protein
LFCLSAFPYIFLRSVSFCFLCPSFCAFLCILFPLSKKILEDHVRSRHIL